MPFQDTTPTGMLPNGSSRQSYNSNSSNQSGDTSFSPSPYRPSSRSQNTPDGNSINNLLRQLEKLQFENERMKVDSARYKRERDDARNQVVNMTAQGSSFTSSFQSHTSPAMAFQNATPAHNGSPSLPSVHSHDQSQPNSLTSSPIRVGSTAMMYAGLPGSIWNSPTSTNDRAPINVALTRFFQNVQTWAEKHAVKDLCSLAKDWDTKNMLFQFENLCNDKNIDRLLNGRLRCIVVAALMNHLFSVCYVDKVLEKYTCQDDQELHMLRSHLESAGVQGKARYELLLRRSNVFNRITMSPRFNEFLDNQSTKVAEMIRDTLYPLMDSKQCQDAFNGLLNLSRDCHRISARMLQLPSEWSISHARAGDRWEPHSMVQCDQILTGDPRLHLQNGNSFKVLLGVSPSFTEKEYSRGNVTPHEHHQKRVLLRENQNIPLRGPHMSAIGQAPGVGMSSYRPQGS